MPNPKIKGNQFWLNRSKHGRDKLFRSPVLLWDAASEYFTWCVKNPLKAQELKVISTGDYKTTGKKYTVDKVRAFTLSGLCVYLDASHSFWRMFRMDIKNSTIDKNPMKNDFLAVINKIEDIIHTQKYENAAAGLLSATLIGKEMEYRWRIESEEIKPPEDLKESNKPVINITIHK